MPEGLRVDEAALAEAIVGLRDGEEIDPALRHFRAGIGADAGFLEQFAARGGFQGFGLAAGDVAGQSGRPFHHVGSDRLDIFERVAEA